MKKLLLISGLLLSINANAGFLMGYALGSAHHKQNNNNNCIIELKKDELLCKADSELTGCYYWDEWKGDVLSKLNVYVKAKGYNFYKKESVCFTDSRQIMIIKVWN